MTGFSLHLAAQPDEALRQAILQPLLAHNLALAGPSGHQGLALALHNPLGQPCGGLWGHTAHGWLYTQMLAVPEAARGKGWGRRLMLAAEAEAWRRGCRHAWVDTQFGARGFYLSLDYTVFGELADYPPGFARSFLRKALQGHP